MAIALTLKVYKGDALVAAKDYDRDIIKIGRLASAHLCLEDEKVSRIHSVIDAADGKLSITDMGSMEGTYVNGKRVNKATLSWGDEIRLGSTRIVIEAKAATAPLGRSPEPTEPVGVYNSSPKVEISPADLASLSKPAAPPPAPAPPPPPPPAPAPVVAPLVVAAPAAPAPAPVAAAKAPLPPAPPPAPVVPPPQPATERVVMTPAHEGKKKAAAVKPHRPKTETTGEVGLQVRFVWGDQVLAIHQMEKPTKLLIGSTKRCQFALSDTKLGTPEFELVRGGGHDYVACLPTMVGEIDDGDRLQPLKESRRVSGEGSAHTVTLTTRDFVWCDLGGGVRAEFAFAPMPKKVVVPLQERMDFRFLNTLLLMFFLVSGFIITAANLSNDDDALADDLMNHQTTVAKFLLKEEKPKKNPFLEKLKEEKKSDAEAAAKAAKDEGKMGRKDKKEDTHQKSGVKAIDPNAKDRAKAMVASLFGSKGGVQTIFGNGGLGGDLKNAVGNMFGNTVGDSGGLGGLGLKGSGVGGGGMGNTVGVGAIGTHGRGGGYGAYGNGAGSLGGKNSTDIGITADNAVVQGSLDKELIRQVIHRNRQQIQYCYETQLTRFPKLEGKVAVAFVIGADGNVMSSRVAQSTVANPELESCLAARFKSWLFPKPKGGGIVQVTYPVLLKRSGE